MTDPSRLSAQDDKQELGGWLWVGWLWVLLTVCWFATIQVRPLLDPDEGRYAEIPREMWVSGDWVTPRLNGVLYFEKPPLQYWATAVAYAAFGVNEWTSRAWPFTLAFLCIAMTFLFVNWVYDPAHGAAAALVLATSPYFVIVGHLGLLDSAFTFFLVGAVLAFLLAQHEPEGGTSESRWMMVAWGSTAFAVLSKGMVAPVLAGGTLLAYSILMRDWRTWRRLHAARGVPLFLLITVPWFWIVSKRYPEFLQFFFVHEHLARFLTTVHAHVEPWWFFLPIVLLGIVPWVPQLWRAIREAWRRPGNAGAIHVERFLVIWCVLVVGFFSASGSKLPSYVLPVMPAVAVLLAPTIVANPRAARRAVWIVLAVVVIAAVGWVTNALRGDTGASKGLIWWAVAAVSVATIASLLTRIETGRLLGVWRYAPLAIGSLLAWQALMLSYGERQPPRTAKSLVAGIGDSIHPGTTVFSVGQYRQSVPVYLRRTLQLVDYEGELAFGLAQERAGALPTVAAFEQEWSQRRDAVAFIEPRLFEQLRARGLPGTILATDARSIVIRRQ